MTEETVNLDLATKTSYFCDNRFIIGNIQEYDIRAANISMCREYGIIDDENYNYMLSINKQFREEFIGLQIKKEKEESDNSSAYEASLTYRTIYDGIKNAKIQLFTANNILPSEVVRIANDAVYVNRPNLLMYTKFGNFIEFKLKMIAHMAIKLMPSLIIFFWTDNNGINIDVKGINDEAKLLHQNYMLSFIGSVLLTYERAGIMDAIHLIQDFYKDYINRNLDKEFYREFNGNSFYKIINSDYSLYEIDDISKIDISYNANLITELWKILLSKY